MSKTESFEEIIEFCEECNKYDDIPEKATITCSKCPVKMCWKCAYTTFPKEDLICSTCADIERKNPENQNLQTNDSKRSAMLILENNIYSWSLKYSDDDKNTFHPSNWLNTTKDGKSIPFDFKTLDECKTDIRKYRKMEKNNWDRIGDLSFLKFERDHVTYVIRCTMDAKRSGYDYWGRAGPTIFLKPGN